MRIRTKILGIIIFFILSTCISVFVYSRFMVRILHVQKEEKVLLEIREQLWIERSYVSDYQFNNLNTHKGQHDDFMAQSISVTETVEQMKYLPNTNEEIQDALEQIKSLDSLLSRQRGYMLELRDDYLEEVETILGDISSTYTRVLTSRQLRESDRRDQFIRKRDSFVASTQVMLNIIGSGLNQLDDQTQRITQEVERLQRNAVLLAMAIIVPLMLLAVFLSLRVIRNIVKSVDGMQHGISSFMAGDLTEPIPSTTQDELGHLSKELDDYRHSLKDSLIKIQEVSQNNLSSKDSLKKSVILSNKSLDSVNGSVKNIDGRAQTLASSMDSAVGAMKSTSQLIEDLSSKISNQYAMVEESSSAITEIISSVDSIAQLADSSRDRMSQLVSTSKEGSERLNETKSVIEEVNGAIESILAMVEIIENISSQTDLLSMNAAIEAAHAGESGRGFSVVAEEIGKLAEVASGNTRDMAQEIGRIVELIRRAGETSEITSNSFGTINEEVNKVEQAFLEIHHAIKELKQGGGQIQQATVQLRDFSAQVDRTANNISSNTSTVLQEVELAGNISQEVKDESQSIVGNMASIKERMLKVENASIHIEEGSLSMDQTLSRFKTQGEEEQS